jgi:hypothetical protein
LQGRVARFKIDLGPAKALQDEDSKVFHVQSGEGRFIAQDGSDAAVLLAALKKVLQAKAIPSNVHRQQNLPLPL